MTDATALANWLVDALVARGVEQAVLCPGSRNAPLSFALAAHPGLTLHSRIDERSAAFVALGIAKTSHRPVPVVTTSGTAAANLHPAVLEAAHAGVPLVAVTADRPASLRATGANQTTDQVRLFGDAAAFADLDRIDDAGLATAFDAGGLAGGPIHLNVQFAEPLVPGVERPQPATRAATRGNSRGHNAQLGGGEVAVRRGPRTVVVAGDDAGPRARILAERAGWPLLAEPTSGSRNGRTPIRTYRLLLGTPLADRIERVIVCGHPTLSRPVSRLLARPDVEVVSVRARGRWPARPFPVSAEHAAVALEGAPDQPDDPGWFEEWQAADAELAARLDAFVAEQARLTPYAVAAQVNAAVPAGGLLLVGASNPIRDLDLMARPYPVGERRLLLANRGLAGIDGTVSTAIGAVLGRPHTTRALLYVGDVTFLHDLNGLLVGPAEQRPDLTIVVANDDGGSIFATLEQGAPEHAADFEKLFGTPHHADLSALCQGYAVPHWQVSERAELAHALANPHGGIEVVEARIGRGDRRAWEAAIRSLAG